MKRKSYPIFFLLCAISYCCISCFCRGPELSRELIKESDIIFEGELIAIDTCLNDEDNDLATFRVSRIWKGKKLENVQVKTDNGSCGFTSYRRKGKDVGRHYLLYSTREKGYYSYATCTNRIVSMESYRASFNDEERDKNNAESKKKYELEISQLDALIKTK